MKISFPNKIQFVATFLLALFSLVIVPKELWHHCEVHSHSHHSEEGVGANGTMENGDHCAICDFQLLPFVHAVETVDFAQPKTFLAHSFQLSSGPVKGSHFTLPGRGPPAYRV